MKHEITVYVLYAYSKKCARLARTVEFPRQNKVDLQHEIPFNCTKWYGKSNLQNSEIKVTEGVMDKTSHNTYIVAYSCVQKDPVSFRLTTQPLRIQCYL